jgi:hypothetical protein
MFKEIESKDLEKRVVALEERIEFLIQPLLYDVTEKALAPIRVGWGSIVLWWMRCRWGTEKREIAKKVLLEVASELALNSPGSWLQEFKDFVDEKKKKI